ncbi:MAG: 4-alpha-glucanotransferase [Candidatus Berkelbacteria bacterium]|nr:4-alpha-glucanotransferase [Candidatus Berkelbacteria bacterium]
MPRETLENEKVACLDLHSPLYLNSKNNPFGGGDIGDLYQIVDKAAQAGFRVLQFTPIQDTGLNPSPYMGISIFSFNPIHLWVNDLPSNESLEGLKKKRASKAQSEPSDSVKYKKLYSFKLEALRAVYKPSANPDPFKYPREILAYAVFKALEKKFERNWIRWPKRFQKAEPKAILKANPELLDEVKFILFTQDILKKQWLDLLKYAREKRVYLSFDKPIYPVPDSAEVWANQQLFYLNPDGSPKYISGCNNPKDPFGPQEWGQSVYKFKEEPDKTINYFILSVQHISQFAQVIRLDHTLALIWKYYLIDSKTKKGKHIPALKHRLFLRLKKELPEVIFIAEDVGYINKREIDIPLGQHHIPGVRCPQWDRRLKYRWVTRYPGFCVALCSNHDLPSIHVWWKKLKSSRRMIFLKQIYKTEEEAKIRKNKADGWDVIELVFSCAAWIASISLRDIIADNRRYNKPGKIKLTNWRLRSPKLTEEINFSKIARTIKKTGRGR